MKIFGRSKRTHTQITYYVHVTIAKEVCFDSNVYFRLRNNDLTTIYSQLD